MKKIFILKGGNDCGKTTKINLVAEWIIKTYSIPNTIGLDITNYEKDTLGVLTIGKLKIGINSAGDTESEVKRIDRLMKMTDEYLDIIICACRTRGKGRKYIIDNYNYPKGWLQKFINIEKFPKTDIANQTARDIRKMIELKTWLTGLEKL